jgi:hypothetical protein
MTGAAEAISVVVPVRWAFEDIRQVLTMPGWADPSAAPAVSTWAKLGLFVVAFTASTVGVLQRRLAPTRRRESSRRS